MYLFGASDLESWEDDDSLRCQYPSQCLGGAYVAVIGQTDDFNPVLDTGVPEGVRVRERIEALLLTAVL